MRSRRRTESCTFCPPHRPCTCAFYSAALGHAYEVTEDNAADAILAQALDAIDFPAVIEAAYRDGVRLFVEMGPGASCTRMIGAILGDRPHRARSVCAPGADGVSAVLRLLGMVIAERVAVDLRPIYGREPAVNAEEIAPGRALVIPIGGEPFAPPAVPRKASAFRHPLPAPAAPVEATEMAPLLAATVDTREAHGQAHAAFLRYTDSVRRTVVDGFAFQASLLESLLNGAATARERDEVQERSPLPYGPGSDIVERRRFRRVPWTVPSAWSSPSAPSAASSVPTSPPSTPFRRASACPTSR